MAPAAAHRRAGQLLRGASGKAAHAAVLSRLALASLSLSVRAVTPTCTLDADTCALLSAVYDYSGGTLAWTSGTPSCSWPGVLCVNSAFFRLDLDSQSPALSGPVPSAVWNAIPPLLPSRNGCGGCWISFANNNLTGSVPPNVIAGCAAVARDNGYPICNFGGNPSLLLPIDVYYASRNWGGSVNTVGRDFNMAFSPGNMSTAVAGWLAATPPITYIRLVNCATPLGTIPASLNSLTTLTYLMLDGSSGISGTIPDLSGLTSLSFISMKSMPAISGSLPASLGALPAVWYLDLTSTPVTGAIPASLCTMPALSQLVLTSTSVNGSLPACLATAMATGPLRIIAVDSTNLAGVIPSAIASYCSYTFAGYGCSFGGTSLTLAPAPDPSIVQAAISSLNATLAGVTTALAALQVQAAPLAIFTSRPSPPLRAPPQPPPPPPAPSPPQFVAPPPAPQTAAAAAASLLSSSSAASSTAVAAALTALSPSNLAASQTSLLTAVASLHSSANTAASASLVLAVLSVGGDASSLTAGTASAALSALSSIASAPVINASDNTVQSLAAALTLVSAVASSNGNASLVGQVSAVQTSILVSLAAQDATANPAAFAAAVSAMVGTPTPGVPLSNGAVNASLAVLASVVTTAPATSGQTIADALSNITTSAAATSSSSALAAVTGVMGGLQAAQVAHLLSNSSGRTSVLLASPNINSTVLLAPPSAAPASLNVPGSTFEPLPAAVLPYGIPVAVQYLSLSFSPYSAATSPGVVTAVGPMARMALSAVNGTAIAVANAAMPISFNMTAVPTTAGAQAACVWWDATAASFSSQGCVSVPDPAPPGHTLGFTPGYATPSNAYLPGAWYITGPLVDQNCQQQLIDCASHAPCSGPVWGANCSVVPNARLPLGASNAAITCPATGTPVLRVVFGGLCSLWQNNSLGCWWSNANQSFVGPGCVSTPGPTQCTCRHLTDFAAARAPSLSSVSTSQLLGLQPGDILTKLRLLFIVVITLFGIMLTGAAVGYVQDELHRTRAMARLMDAERYGFAAAKDGTWTWTLRQEPLLMPIGAPAGTAVAITDVFGIPFVRLRCALPEELLPGSLPQALGRLDGLSTSGLGATKEHHEAVFTALRWRHRHVAATPAAVEVVAKEACMCPATPPPPDPAACLVGTALVFAFMATRRLVPVAQLEARRAAASAFFAGCTLPGVAHGFDALHRYFTLMLGFNSGSMANTRRWLDSARLWRLILLQQPDGGWELSDSLAFVTRAHAGRAAARPLAGCLSAVPCLAPCLDSVDPDAAVEGDDLPARSSAGVADEQQQQQQQQQATGGTAAVAVDDCPLTFSPEEMRARMPGVLRSTPGGERLWATALACGVLGDLTRSWLVCGEAGESETILDAGQASLAACCTSADPDTAAFILSGDLAAAAARCLHAWRGVHDAVVSASRSKVVLGPAWLFTHRQRATSRVLKTLVTEHKTFATFLDSEGRLHRWEAFMVLVTLVLSSLLVSIWFYSSRGAACCAELRGLLHTGAGGDCSAGVPASPPVPGPSSAFLPDGGLASTCLASNATGQCLGATCDCGSLLAQFGSLPGAYPYSPTVQCSSSPSDPSCFCRPTLADYACHAFPDDAYVSDQVLVGLVAVAVALPSRIVLEQAFLASAAVTETAEGWLIYAGLPRLLLGWTSHRRWVWATQRPSDLVIWVASTYPEALKFPWLAFSFLGWWLPKQLLPGGAYAALEARFGGRSWSAGWLGVALLVCGPFGWLVLIAVALTARRPHTQHGTASSGGGEHGGAAGCWGNAATRVKLAATGGVLAVLAAWAIYAWFVFTFGMQVYSHLGADAEKKFAQTWGIGYGLDQAAQWKEVAQTALKAAMVVVLLDALRVKSHWAWLEEAADFASVQCVLFDGVSRTWWQQTQALMARQYRAFDE